MMWILNRETMEIAKVIGVSISTILVGIYNKIINLFLVNIMLTKMSVYDAVIEEIVRTGTAVSILLGVVYVAIKIIKLVRNKKG